MNFLLDNLIKLMNKKKILLFTWIWVSLTGLNNTYASVDVPFAYLDNVYKGNVNNESISSYTGCCPSGKETPSTWQWWYKLSKSILNNVNKVMSDPISDIKAFTYDRDWNASIGRALINKRRYKNYNLKKDLWLPTIRELDFLFEAGYNDIDKNPSGFFTKSKFHARDWNYSIYESTDKWKTSYYNLYTWNGKRWGICKPYYIVGMNRLPSNDKSSFDKKKYDALFFNWNNLGIFAGNRNWMSWLNDVWNAKKYIFYFPFSTDSSWNIKKELNIVSWKWHLNWKLDPSDIKLKFSFY